MLKGGSNAPLCSIGAGLFPSASIAASRGQKTDITDNGGTGVVSVDGGTWNREELINGIYIGLYGTIGYTWAQRHFDFYGGTLIIVYSVQEEIQGEEVTYTFTPSAYQAGVGNSVSNSANPIGKDENNTSTRATVTPSPNVDSTAYWKFDCSSIPRAAIPMSVKCKSRAAVSNTSYLSERCLYLTTGTYQRGTKSSNLTTTSAVYNVDGGEMWSREDLDDCGICVYGKRTSTLISATESFYGATLTVTCFVPTYNIVSESISGCSLVPSGNTTVRSESDYTLNIFPNSDLAIPQITVIDNGLDVSDKVTNNKYTIKSVSENHTVSVICILFYQITTETTDGTITPQSILVQEGESPQFTINSIYNPYHKRLTDNDTDVSERIKDGIYTITDIREPHHLTLWTCKQGILYMNRGNKWIKANKICVKRDGQWETIEDWGLIEKENPNKIFVIVDILPPL